jgi:ketosteroid isomerase-like protein
MLGWYTIGSEEALMSVTDAEAIADVADRLFEAIEQSDIAMVQQLWNSDVIVWKTGEPRDRDKERAMRVCIVIKLGANGLINRIDEYFDPAEMAPLLESADSQRR